MAVWKLTPLDPRYPEWAASSHRAMAIVRAPDEESAHEVAQEACGVKSGFKPGQGIKASPWQRPALVKAERIVDDCYDPDGPAEALEPAF